MSPIIAIIGATATGKSTLRRHLAEALTLPAYDIYEERQAIPLPPTRGLPRRVWSLYHAQRRALSWQTLVRKVEAAGPCIVETSGVYWPPELEQYPTFAVLVTAPVPVRCGRLQERVTADYPGARMQRGYAETMLHRAHREAGDVVYDGGDTAPIVAACRAFLEAE